MKKLLLLSATLIFGISSLFSQLYVDDFESYDAGDYIAVENPDWWTTWTGSPGGDEDAIVSDEQAASGTKSIKVEGLTDAILKFDNKTVGKYLLSFKYYVPSGYGAYYNIQHFESPGVEWAYEVFFGATGAGYLNAGSEQVAGFNYDPDTWVDVENIIDIDNDWTQLYINGTLIYEWPFSYQATATTGTLQLGAMDVWAGAPTGETPLYYMDDLSFEAVASALYEDDMESYAPGDYIAVVNPDWFTTWSNTPGTTEDALVVDEQANSGSNSVKVEGISDLVLKLGDQTSGKYQLSFYYYIPSGFGGYYNIQHFESPGVEWAYEVYFGATGQGYLNAGAEQIAGFDYTPDTWVFCDQIIDLSEDMTELYIDGTLIYEWPFSYQATSTTGTLQLGGVNFYAGAPTGETATYFFDDIEFVQLEAGTGAAVINLDPVTILETLEGGSTSSQTMNIENTGEVDLDYSIVVTYPDGGKAQSTSSGKVNNKVILSASEAPNAIPGGAPDPTDDVILNYDGDNSSAVGLTDGGEMRVAAVFTPDEVGDYIGMELTSIEVYINDQPISTKAQVYNYGTIALPGPGELILEQEWTPLAMSWQTATLDNPVLISGGDIWVGYLVDHDPGTFPAGTDVGPHHPNGDWISSGPGWHHLSDNAALDYNWNIRATLTGEAIEQWLAVSPTSGTVAVGASTDIMVDFDATNLLPETYSAELVVNNTDPNNPQVIVPVTLAVFVGVDEVTKSAVMLYPNPATENLNVKSDVEIYSIEIMNMAGQTVETIIANGTFSQVNTTDFASGYYMVKVETAHGTIMQKVSIK